MQYREKENSIKLGKRIKELRMQKSHSLNAFVNERGGLTTASWSRIENGKFDAKFSSLIKVASMLGISLSELFLNIDWDYSIED